MNEPLAQRLRTKTRADVCGQQHLLAEGPAFRRTIESGRIPNMIFYGPSGTGKTTCPSARRCCWPQTSASVLGRRRCASGSFMGLPSKNDHENPSLL